MGRKILLIIGAATLFAACRESTGPPSGPRLAAPAERLLHHLQWLPSPEERQFVALPQSGGGALDAAAPAGALPLDNYQLSFWVRQATERSVSIRYLAADAVWRPYLTFSVAKGGLARHANGAAVGGGDSVLITITIDTTNLLVQFEPTGLVFSDAAPARLEIWYTGANPDFDGGGTVDAVDADIEQRLLGVWVQKHAGSPWAGVTASRSPTDRVFKADLGHFSGYAVSW